MVLSCCCCGLIGGFEFYTEVKVLFKNHSLMFV